MQKKEESGLVSVVIPTISTRKKELQRALKSVKNQTYKNIEIIVVDEGLPAPQQRNIGIKQSRGEFIAFLDDDDIWLPEKIEEQVKLMNKKEFKHVGLCVTWILDKRFGKERVNKTPAVIYHDYVLEAFNLQSTSAYMFRKSHLKKYGGFDTTLSSAHEYDLAIRISKYSPIFTVPKVLVIQNETKDQISENWKRKIQGILEIYKKYHNEYKIKNYIIFLGVIALYISAYIIGNRIHSFIVPWKERAV